MISTRRACAGALVVISLVAVLAAGVAGGEPRGAGESGRSRMPQQTIAQVLNEQTDRLMSVEGVIGVAQGHCDGHPCIKVFVKKKTAAVRRKLPVTVGGYPVSIEETDEFRALDR